MSLFPSGIFPSWHGDMLNINQLKKKKNTNLKPLWCWCPRCFASRHCEIFTNAFGNVSVSSRPPLHILVTGAELWRRMGGRHEAEKKSTTQFPLLNRTLWGQSLVGANRQLTKLDSESCFVILSNASQRWEACMGTSHSRDLHPPPPSIPYQSLASCQLLRLLVRAFHSQGCTLIFKFLLIHRLGVKLNFYFPSPPSFLHEFPSIDFYPEPFELSRN